MSSLTITNDSQNSLSITNADKTADSATWNEMVITWDEASGTWNQPGTPFTNETQNSLTITNENV